MHLGEGSFQIDENRKQDTRNDMVVLPGGWVLTRDGIIKLHFKKRKKVKDQEDTKVNAAKEKNVNKPEKEQGK